MKFCFLIGALLSFSPLYAHEVYFAPYEGPRPVSFETRFDIYPWHRSTCFSQHQWSCTSAFTLNAYVRSLSDYFYTVGTFMHHGGCVQVASVNFQVGKYWKEWGALRGGFMYDGLGIGADVWLIYKNKIKWLTTCEVGLSNTFEHSAWFDRRDTLHGATFLRWINRIFFYETIFLSCGIDFIQRMHTHDSLTQAFIGFGTTI